jgi:acyl-homoserine lactone acylase PvdQ
MYIPLLAPVDLLKRWDYRCAENSIATTIAIEWAQQLSNSIQKVYIEDGEADQVQKTKQFAATATAYQLLQPLYTAITELNNKYGTWQIPWGDINRFQRISGDINQQYNDDAASVPVAFASSAWGMLPAYNSRSYAGTKKRYGFHGNSFICAVEFGAKVKARSLLAGGQSGNPASRHFNDQLEMYSKGIFKDVLFYKEDVLQHAGQTYHPGE